MDTLNLYIKQKEHFYLIQFFAKKEKKELFITRSCKKNYIIVEFNGTNKVMIGWSSL